MSSNLGFEAQPSRSAIFINNGNPFTRSTGTNYANDPMVSPDSDIETHSTRGWKNPGREVVQGSCYYNNVCEYLPIFLAKSDVVPFQNFTFDFLIRCYCLEDGSEPGSL